MCVRLTALLVHQFSGAPPCEKAGPVVRPFFLYAWGEEGNIQGAIGGRDRNQCP